MCVCVFNGLRVCVFNGLRVCVCLKVCVFGGVLILYKLCINVHMLIFLKFGCVNMLCVCGVVLS